MVKIAIIDDEEQILSMLDKYLKKLNKYSIVTFADPMAGLLRYCESNSVDVILSDIMMPKMDGLELTEKIKTKKPEMKVIMMTAYSTLDRVLTSHKLGANGYIMKPFESLSLIDKKIDEVLKS